MTYAIIIIVRGRERQPRQANEGLGSNPCEDAHDHELLKKSVRNPLTNFKAYDIIKIQRAREAQPERNGLTHESL